jgi:D-sedoheptulose 7-phosphate isomerase
MSTADLLKERIDQAADVLAALREDSVARALDAVAKATTASLRAGGKILLCGNGGSAADAQHLAAEMIGRFCLERRALGAIALADNVAALTAVANDYAFEDVYARAVEALGRPGDVLIGLSTSGRSTNVVRALERGRAGGLTTVVFVSSPEGPMCDAADHVLSVPGSNTARIQEGHKLIGHTLFEIVERELCG